VAAEGHGLKKDNRDDDVLTFFIMKSSSCCFGCFLMQCDSKMVIFTQNNCKILRLVIA